MRTACFVGESIVLYRKRDGLAVALDDTCSQPYPSLYLGQLKDDVVEWAYHGLRFDSGQCVHNPYTTNWQSICGRYLNVGNRYSHAQGRNQRALVGG
ncbi:MAG: Rieske 2Fe-2S domain-containing protein [Gammaproteobacteria bacterium]